MFRSVFVYVLCVIVTITIPQESRTDSIFSHSVRWKRQVPLTPQEENDVLQLLYNCKCVLYYQCDNGTIIQDGAKLIEFRDGDDLKTVKTCKGGEFEGQLRCCKLNSTDEVVEPSEPTPKGPDSKTATDKTFEKKECGVQRPIFTLRVFAGEAELVATDGEFPWIAAIFKKDEDNAFKFHCSGSLIHPKVVLTANHYFGSKSSNEFKVVINGRVGVPSIGLNKTEERNVIEIINHPEYYGGAAHYDVALLILEQPYSSTDSNVINSICLPPKEFNLENVKCLISGWGKGSEINGKKVLKKVELPFVPFQRCQELLRKTALGEYFNLHKSFMCAGGEKGKDACKGDGGSPLMCAFPSTKRYYQIGIVSWGVGCGDANVPGVYSDVSVVREWIEAQLAERNLLLDQKV